MSYHALLLESPDTTDILVLLVLRCSYNKHWHSDGQVVTPAIELCYWLLIPAGALHVLSEG